MIARKTPEFTVALDNTLVWTEMIRDFDTAQYPTGTKISAQDWNSLFVKATYQENYNTDSLKAFIETYYNATVVRVNANETNIDTIDARVTVVEGAAATLAEDILALQNEIGDMGAILDIINGEVI